MAASSSVNRPALPGSDSGAARRLRSAAALAAVLALLGAGFCGAQDVPLVRQQGTAIVDAGGKPLQLRGTNLGNWLTLEMWLFGESRIPDQKTFLDVLRDRFGDAGEGKLLDEFRDGWITEVDFARIRDCGMNVVRLPFHWSLLQRDDGTLDEAGFAWIDRALDQAARNGLLVILDLHGAPGGQSVEQPTGEIGADRLWDAAECRRRTVEIWRAVARRYRNDARVAAYDLLNEPYGREGTRAVEPVLLSLCDDLLGAIRQENDRHLVFVPATERGPFFYPAAFFQKWPGVGITEHFYPALYDGDRTIDAHARYIPGHILPRKRFADRMGVPFYVGEYNVVLQAAGGDGMMRRYVDLYEGLGWAHTMWCYKAIHPEGGLPRDDWALVGNAAPLRMPDPRSASFGQLEAFFASLKTAAWTVDSGLRDVYARSGVSMPALPSYPEPPGAAPGGCVDVWNGWTGIDVGGATPAGGVVPGETGHATVYGGGYDIDEGDDAFYFLRRALDGDGALEVRIDSLDASQRYAKAGLMVRASLAPDAPFLFLHVFPDGEVVLGSRRQAGAKAGQRPLGRVSFPIRLRLARQGGRIVLSFAEGDEPWRKPVVVPALEGNGLQAGFVLLSHDSGTLAACPLSLSFH